MKTTQRTGMWMQTFTGRKFYPLDPRPEDFNIVDIAHALSHVCRFGGHVKRFYSVAQHSVIVADILPARLKLAGLLHDATEAYLVDIPRPLKVALPDYKRIEENVAGVIGQVFGVDFDDPLIKHADNRALMTEARDLLGPRPEAWCITEKPLRARVVPMSPARAQAEFFKAYTILTT